MSGQTIDEYMLARKRPDGSTQMAAKRATVAYWAYSSVRKVVEELETPPRIVHEVDQKLSAIRDLFQASGIDLEDPVQRDVLVVFVKLVNSLCANEDELLMMLMGSAEVALAAEPNLPRPSEDG